MIENLTPIVIFLLMLIIGTKVNVDDVITLKKYKKAFVLATVGQIIVLPLVAVMLIFLTSPPKEVAGALLLVALCPSGIVSNAYSFFAKGNVGFSIGLTTVNALFMFVLLPLLLINIIPLWVELSMDIVDLVVIHLLNFLLLLALPVTLGMIFRETKPELTKKVLPALECIGAISLVALIILIFFDLQQYVIEQMTLLVALALSFTVIAIVLAYCMSRYLGLSIKEEASLLLELPIKNFGLTTIIAIVIFDKPEFLMFIAVFFMSQVPFIGLLILWYRRKIKALI